jgi:leucyl-tRNA synthetase
MLGETNSIFKTSWPKYEEKYLVENSLRLAVQVNGKLRGEIEVEVGASEEFILEQAISNEAVAKFLEKQEIIKKIYVKGKLVSLVVKPV